MGQLWGQGGIGIQLIAIDFNHINLLFDTRRGRHLLFHHVPEHYYLPI